MEAPRRGAAGSRTGGRLMAMTAAAALGIALVVFLPDSASANESSDNDLVFDDVAPIPSQHVSSPKIALLHPGEVLSPDYQLDSPDGKVKKTVCRMVKKDPPKGLFSFGLFGKKAEPVEEEVCEEVEVSEEEEDDEEEGGGGPTEEQRGPELLLHREERATTAEDEGKEESRREEGPADDVDYLTDDASGDDELPEGSAMPDKSPLPIPATEKPLISKPDAPRFYRIIINIHEPYREEFKDRTSPLYRMIAQNITRAVDDLYKTSPGRQSSTVIKIEKNPDNFISTVTLDLGTAGNNDTDAIRSILERQIQTYRTLGDLTVNAEGFYFRDIGAPEPSKPHECPEGQMPCRQAGCVSVDARCDGHNDCADGSDELGCPPPATEAPTPLPTAPPREILTVTPKTVPSIVEVDIDSEEVEEAINGPTDEDKEGEEEDEKTDEEEGKEKEGGLEIPVPTAPPLDRCRADDKVRCSDGSAVICTVQLCDGKRDCADGFDEKDCPATPTECAHDEFACDMTRCIHKSQRCDGKVNCSDEKDEMDCPGEVTQPPTLPPLPPITTKGPDCDEDQFMCNDGRCIDEFRRCDLIADCPGGEDEDRCPCTSDEFTCKDGTCIENTKKCDGREDCPDSSDEKGCEACPQNQWECQDGSCIDARLRCNKQEDCRDASDEQGCPSSPTSTSPSLVCGQGLFRCRDGTCIEDIHRCDKNYDCRDGSDEHSCSIPCPSGDFRCDNGVCIDRHRQCDGNTDCNDLSDERNCLGPCTSHEFRCRDGRCIEGVLRCNSQFDCADHSDEEDCGPRPLCRSDQFSCNDGTCLSISQRCNNIQECVSGEDEQGCARCSESEFRCSDGRCIDLNLHCDGHDDCGDNEDEEGCVGLIPILRCLSHQWKCFNGLSCVNEENICDNIYHCSDGSDESPEACYTNLPGGSLAPCPASDFTCSDGSCLPMSQRCDGITQCPNAADEIGCESCKADEFRCKDGTCIKQTYRCDSFPDCKDNEDEQDCDIVDAHCEPDEIICDGRQCVKKSKKCDGIFDCIDGLDEEDCDVCHPGEYRCSDGVCVDEDKRCDGHRDCHDGSDEADCVTTCRPTEFRCNDGTCVNANLRCNGHSECRDGSDEISCDSRICGEGQFQCGDGVCIAESFRCDTFKDCLDGSDEVNCPCAPNEFLCPDQRTCVPEDKRCDRIRDCPSGWDEQSCRYPGQCAANEFLCPDRRTCVPEHKRCDRISDCPDGWDESTCVGQCAANEFLCSDRRTCVPEHKRCDRQRDCPDGWDESSCPDQGQCSVNEFLCSDRRTCVPEYKRCDRVSDCPDGWDESDCIHPETCSPSDFTCRDGACIDSRRKCDRRRDCRDGSDEEGCGEQGNCLPNEFMCGEGMCIDIKHRCDNLYDCRDFSDEQNCLDTSCRQNEFRCGSGECISQYYLCNRRYECADGSDERNCQPATPAPARCGPREYLCRANGRCLPQTTHCDGKVDCPDYTDESNCGPATPAPARCGPREYLCRANGRCLPQTTHCDGKVDCPDYTDESNCAWKPCDWNEFRCEGGPCIPLTWRCDGKSDCPEKSDELDCSSVSRDGLNLKTYPPDQIIKEIGKDREVVFQCRDEGPVRAQVKWSRSDGTPLPPGSRDNNGRLEMPNIQLSHTGTYVCEAVGYPENTPGSRVSVYLKVEPFEHPPTRPPTACGLHQATCSNGECISKSQVCDGRLDCSDGSDEMRCSPHGCEPNEFRCENKKCVLKTWRCDSDDDCGDGSDEKGCVSIPGSVCRYDEYQCRSGGQCIPKSFHCDGETDCHDGSDEVGCSLAIIVTPPPPMLTVEEGQVFTITCKAVGVPTPEIVWRLNWGHVPEKCRSTSVGGLGTLTCPNAEQRDQGAYSCEAVNVRGGSVFAVPDCILVVKSVPSDCGSGFFSALTTTKRECIPCFCFGVISECRSANLFIHQLPPPINVYKIVGVQVEPSGRVSILPSLPTRTGQPEIRPLSSNGLTVYYSEPNERTLFENYVVPYFSMPENYHGNLLKSYGGYLKYTVRSEGQGRDSEAPDVILSGNGYTLVHPGRKIVAGRNNDISVRFFYGEWYKQSYARHGGDIPGEPTGILASREEIMMTLANVDYLLIRAMYDDGNHMETTISNIAMDTADASNVGLGAAAYVEECQCPAGYYGLSCERCSPGYHRVKTGPWLGNCIREESCQPGYYGDPGRGIACQVCPCPLTSPSNQFGRTCILDSDGQPTCSCPQGYKGRRCEICAEGYEGNPLVPGSSCRRIVDHCNPIGSLSRFPDPRTGQCICKENVIGALCDQCKANAFYLAQENDYGCLMCFCMGITNQCQSSSWYRDKITASFGSSTMNIKLVRRGQIPQNITEGIRINPSTREVVFSDFPRGGLSGSEVHYWSLPDQFLGDKVTSYGGFLTFTLRYVPAPGGQSSRNNAPIVEILSGNNLHLLYFGGETVGPDKQETITIRLMEQNWERLDSKPVDRANFLMALADVKAILIKAAYTTNTREAALKHVEMDIAVDRNTGAERAFPVEHCACPRGYIGLSCEECAPGYTRDDSGIYLGRCQPCQCNGHSEDCDRDTGFCRNCRDNTWGTRCNECRPGYTGDATNRNIGCTVTARPCNCDPRGSIRPDCPSGDQCVCKANVAGRYCDECREGSFGLSQSLPSGCHECFCSGVSNRCYASTKHYRIQIPMQIGTAGYEFTLTDSTRREITITDGFTIDVSRNEIGYTFPQVGVTGRSNRLFWSLPSAFTGNKVTSYGGKLTITQRYMARPGSHEYSDTDVIISGNGITLYWKNPAELVPNQPFTYTVPLFESEWRHLDQSTPRPASRADLMTVLINLDAILVRASYASATVNSYLSDVSMDTAVTGRYAQETLATDIEECYCPPGYTGTSCETCDRGYYLDFNDRSVGVFGTCKKCPCNDNEESCALHRERNDYVIRCRCKQGYDESQFCAVGQIVSNSIILSLVTINSNPRFGEEVEFTCSVQKSDQPLRLEFTEVKEGDSASLITHARMTDERYGYERKYTLVVAPGIKALICTAYDSLDLEVARAISYIKTKDLQYFLAYESGPGTKPPKPPVRPPTISVVINEPSIQIVEAGGSVRYRCSGSSLRAQIPVRIIWTKEGGALPAGRSQDDGQGLLIITNLQPSDSGTYLCEVTDGESFVTERAVLTVGARPSPPSLTIHPAGHQVAIEGSPVEFRCEASGTPLPALQWSRQRGGSLNPTAVFQDGLFRIMSVQKSDEGEYVCVGTGPSGTDSESVILYVREGEVPRPSPVRVEPQSFEGNAGETVRLSCAAVHDRRASVRWSRDGGDLPASATLTEGGTTLSIYSATAADSGIYICTTVMPSGETVQAQARVTILSYRSPPTVRIEPDRQTIPQGTSTELRCLASGDPTPSIIWSKAGQELSSNVQIIGQLLRLNNAQVSDRGVYLCIAKNTGGTSQASAIIEVESAQRQRLCNRHQFQCSDGTCIPREKYCDRRRDCADSSDELYCQAQSGEQICRNHEFQCSNGECIAREKQCNRHFDCNDHSDELYCVASRGRQAPSVELYPDSRQVVSRGGSALVQCRITDGIPTPKLTWSRVDGRPFTSNVEELQGGVLRFNKVTGPEAGQYLCRAENEAGSTNAIANLEMQSLPQITLKYPGSEHDSRQYHVTVGDRVRMECSADGDPAPSVSWSRHHPGYPRYDSAAETKESSVYEITRVSLSDAGTYKCEARNSLGTAQERLQLVVNSEGNEVDSPGGHYRPEHGVILNNEKFTVLEDGSVTMRCTVEDNRERIFLSWIRGNQQPMPAEHRIQDGTLFLSNVKPDAAGEYICQGIGQSGNTLFTASSHLEVIAPPRIKLNPTRQVVRPGDNAYISCTATGDQPITLTWVRQDGAMPRSVLVSGGSLQFRGIELSDAGRYRCIAKNAEGEADAVADVIIDEQHQVVRAMQREVSTYMGSSVELRCSPQQGSRVTWTRGDGQPLPRGSRERDDHQSGESILELFRVSVEDGGRYLCHAESPQGSSSDFVDLRVERKQRIRCQRHEFQCSSGECIAKEKRCDRRSDCHDRSDEMHCRHRRGVSDISLHIDASPDIVRVGDTVDIRCGVSGDPSAVVSWSKVGEQFSPNVQTRGNLLRVNNVTPRNGGIYTCTAQTTAGLYKEDYVLTIIESGGHSETPVTTPAPIPIVTRSAPYGAAVVMECHTDLEPPVTHAWSRQGGFLPKEAVVDMDMLTIPVVQPSDAGIYICTAKNDAVKMDILTVLVVKDVIQRFDQHPVSFISLPTLPSAYLQFSVEISFKPESPDGLILYNGQQPGGAGDFVSFGLSQGHPELRFDVGSGPAIIRSPEPVTLGQWHTVKLDRNRKEGSMYVDGAGPYTGTAAGRFQGLDLEEPLYIGGVPEFSSIHRLAGFSQGFIGCISRLVVGNKEHELVHDATSSEGVSSCDTCSSEQGLHCRNNGICQEANTANGFVCICPSGFSGDHCERVGEACFPGACTTGRCVNDEGGFSCLCPIGRKGTRCEEELVVREPAFAGDGGYAAYPTPKALKRLKLNLRFKPNEVKNGILLYCAQSEDGKGDFTSLTINNKHVEFRYDVGSGTAILRSNKELEAGQWMSVTAGRDGREGFLSVDGEETVSGKSPGITRGLNLKTPLYVGGYNRQKVKISPGVGLPEDRNGYIDTFDGCITRIEASGLDLDVIQSVVDSANVAECSEHSGYSNTYNLESRFGEEDELNGKEHGNEILLSPKPEKKPCETQPCQNDAICQPATHNASDYECHCAIGFRGRHCESSDSLCDSLKPCQNGGTCVSSSPSSYYCLCSLGYGGKNCDQRVEFGESVGFQGDGYLELSPSLLPHHDANDLESIVIEFSTTSSDGIMFWHGQTPETDGRGQDFLAVAVVDGHLEFSYELGSGAALISLTQSRVDDGKRHRVVFHRQGRDGSIELDGEHVQVGISGGFLTMLNTAGNIYLGGLPKADYMTAGKYTQGFSGCIHSIDLKYAGTINLYEKALSAVNAHPCSNDKLGEDDDDNNNKLDGLDRAL